jgi:hypothetical protein
MARRRQEGFFSPAKARPVMRPRAGIADVPLFAAPSLEAPHSGRLTQVFDRERERRAHSRRLRSDR